MWKDDGSSACTPDQREVRCTPTEEGSQKYNAMWVPYEGGMKEGTHCWAFTVKEGEASVGVTNEESFKQGWGCNGFFYGGNVGSGGALITQNFGPRPKTGDVVKIVVAMGDKLDVGVVVNDKRLGLAFSVPEPYPKDLFPVAAFSEAGTVHIIRVDEIPENFRQREVERHTGMNGHWKIDAELTPDDVSDFKDDEGFGTMQLRLVEPTKLEASVKIMNHINTVLEKTGDGDSWKAGLVQSTMMMAPDAVMNFEQRVAGVIEKVEKISLSDDTDHARLSITAAGGDVITLSRYVPVPPTSCKNPLAVEA